MMKPLQLALQATAGMLSEYSLWLPLVGQDLVCLTDVLGLGQGLCGPLWVLGICMFLQMQGLCGLGQALEHVGWIVGIHLLYWGP